MGRSCPRRRRGFALPLLLALLAPLPLRAEGTVLGPPVPRQPPPPVGAAALLGEEPLTIASPLAPASAPAQMLAPASTLAPAPAPAPVPVSTGPAPVPPQSPAPGPSQAPGPVPAPALAPATDRALVLDRRHRIVRLLENGRELRRFPVAVGMPGWETPVGTFKVLSKTSNPVWEHPEKGTQTPPGPANPLGSRWIGFHTDCTGRRGWDGERILDVKGCVVAGFHGTPHRWTVGQAVSHGCVRLYDEDVRQLFDFVSLGTPVTVLP